MCMYIYIYRRGGFRCSNRIWLDLNRFLLNSVGLGFLFNRDLDQGYWLSISLRLDLTEIKSVKPDYVSPTRVGISNGASMFAPSSNLKS